MTTDESELLAHTDELGRDLMAANDLIHKISAERDRYRDALERIYADAVTDHPSVRDYAGDVLAGGV